MKRLTILLLALSLAVPASALWRTSSGGTVLHVYYCASPARAARVPQMIAWKYGNADTISQILAAHWLRVASTPSSANCTGGQTEVGWSFAKAVADQLAELILRSEGYDDDTSDGRPDYDAMTAAQRADAFSAEVRDDLLQWEAEYNAHLAAEAAPAPDPVEPLE